MGFTLSRFTSGAGVPQGSVLSPLLYIIFVRDMVPEETGCLSVAQFADDTALWANDSLRASAQRNLQGGLDDVYRWC